MTATIPDDATWVAAAAAASAEPTAKFRKFPLTTTLPTRREEAGSVGVLLLVRLPVWVTRIRTEDVPSKTSAATSCRGGPAAWPAPADCGGAAVDADIAAAAAAAAGDADEVGVVEGVRSQSVHRLRSGHARQDRSGRTNQVARRRRHLRRHRSGPLRLARRLCRSRLTCR